MRVISKKLPMKQREVVIYPLADLHLGDKFCNIEAIKSVIAEIAERDNAYCVLNGDIINNTIKTSVGDVYSEQLPPMEQLRLAESLFEPIKKKILCITGGNHEARTYRNDGIDLMGMFAHDLGLINVYSAESVVLFLSVGTNHGRTKDGQDSQYNFSICIRHGSGGGIKEGGKINKLAEMSGIVDTDVYIHSHTHLPAIMKEAFYRVSPEHMSVTLVDKLFVNTNAFLRYGGYGETFGFKPASIEVPKIFLWGANHVKHMTASL